MDFVLSGQETVCGNLVEVQPDCVGWAGASFWSRITGPDGIPYTGLLTPLWKTTSPG